MTILIIQHASQGNSQLCDTRKAVSVTFKIHKHRSTGQRTELTHFQCSASQPHVYSSSAIQLHAHLSLVSKHLNMNEDTEFAKITAQTYLSQQA